MIGVDMGAACQPRAGRLWGKGHSEMYMPLDIDLGPQICLGQVDTYLHEMVKSSGLKMSDIKAVGTGVPGPIVAEAGMVSGPRLCRVGMAFPSGIPSKSFGTVRFH